MGPSVQLNPDLITPDLLNDNVDELGPADREAMQAPPTEPAKKKKVKKAKEVKKPLTVAVSEGMIEARVLPFRHWQIAQL